LLVVAPDATAVALDDALRRRADRARQVAAALRRQVLHGGFPDRVLPGEAELVAEFATSRNTVRDALELLRAEGLIDRFPGVGTVVIADKHPHGLEHLLGLGETLHGQGVVTNQVRAAGPVVAPSSLPPSS
jgi:GntR family transcriptional regulator